MKRLAGLSFALLSVACGQSSTVPSDAESGVDAGGRVDAGGAEDASPDSAIGPDAAVSPDAASLQDARASEAGADGSRGMDGGGGSEDGGNVCDTDGETRPVSCGNCGLAQERCEAGVWTRGECLSEGSCGPGDVDTEERADCTTASRICDSSCEWSDWTISGTPGECERGATRTVTDACGIATEQPQVCNDLCEWEDAGDCGSACGTLRASPPDSVEVCVPAGTFIRGDDSPSISDAGPETEVFVSRFAIDKFPVTNRRYRECVEAGTCYALPEAGLARDNYEDPTKADHPVLGLYWNHTNTFCEWDGRRLPTEAEFEKAARGPMPRDNPWTWDGDTYRCDLLTVLGCPGFSVETHCPASEPVTALPALRSYYGAEAMIGLARHWVSDFWSPDYFSEPDSVDDPQGPASGATHVAKSTGRREGCTQPDVRISVRHEYRHVLTTFRCARSVPAGE